MNNHLLIVDDDRALSPMVEEYLAAKGYKITLCHNATDGLCKFKDLDIDLCILDIRMPMKDGFTLAEEIQEYSPEIPFLFLTSETDKKKRIKGLILGASDYILKPFSMEELYLRINIILKRSVVSDNALIDKVSEFRFGDFHFNSNTRELIYKESDIKKLSTIENQLLQFFCEAENGFLDRKKALKNIWDDELMLRAQSLNVYVSKLRKYLEKDSSISFHNIHGIGYRMSIK